MTRFIHVVHMSFNRREFRIGKNYARGLSKRARMILGYNYEVNYGNILHKMNIFYRVDYKENRGYSNEGERLHKGPISYAK